MLPILGYINKNEEIIKEEKKKSIISVGRLTSEGHCKNHHHIIEAFKMAVDRRVINSEWQLSIIGSCDLLNTAAVNYFNLLQEKSIGYNIEIIANCSREELDLKYKEAYIYLHATGLGIDLDEPEKHEHFGITPHEAMRFGCYPIVYYKGGPAEQISDLLYSAKFSTTNEMIKSIHNAVEKYNDNLNMIIKIQEYAKIIENKSSQAVHLINE